jgi:hypothetical protein
MRNRPGAAIRGAKERQRSKWQEIVNKVCTGLCIIGVDDQVAEQHRPEERIIAGSPFARRFGGSGAESLGLIEIHRDPIHCGVAMKR